jgi:hypothetical protein
MSKIAFVAQSALIPVFFAAGSAKLLRTDYMVAEFDRFGYNPLMMLFVGAVQAVCAGGLLLGFMWPNLAVASGLTLAAVMIVAAGTHVWVGDSTRHALLPSLLGGMAAWVAVVQSTAPA